MADGLGARGGGVAGVGVGLGVEPQVGGSLGVVLGRLLVGGGVNAGGGPPGGALCKVGVLLHGSRLGVTLGVGLRRALGLHLLLLL